MRRLNRSLLPLLLLAGAYAVMVQASGANQASHYALVRALEGGSPVIDRWAGETMDKSWYEGHFYSVKAPGMALATVPWFAALDATGVAPWARERGERVAARDGALTGDARAREVKVQRPVVWLLALWAVVLPAALLLLMVRAAAERFAPGWGTATAVVAGAGTLLLPYATMLYSHVPAAALVFAAFLVLLRERDGPPRPWLVAAAGLLAGLAVLVEYPTALIGAIVGLYALGRTRPLLRGATYAAGVLVGVLPLALYNLWAFGSVTHLSYDDAVAVEGASGHDVLGLNDDGLFGVQVPDPGTALDLLLAPKGLLTLAPVVAAAVYGVFVLHRRGSRAEARVIGGVLLACLVYNAGYYLPFAGDVPGPRLLVPMLPFAAVGIAVALRERPGPVLALALASVVGMVAATISEPQLVGQDTARWVHLLSRGDLQFTVLGAAGAGHGWLGILPFLALVGAALALALRALPRAGAGELRLAAVAVLVWALAAALVAPLLEDRTADALWLVAAGAAAGLAAAAWWARRADAAVAG